MSVRTYERLRKLPGPRMGLNYTANWFEPGNALAMAEDIQNHWHEKKKYNVRVWTEIVHVSKGLPYAVIRSNLVNGLPPKVH